MSTLPIPPVVSQVQPADVAGGVKPAGEKSGAGVIAGALGWASMVSGLIGLVLLCVGDPYWVSLLCALTAAGLGRSVLRRLSDSHGPALVGCALGGLIVMLWVCVELVLGKLAGVDVSVFLWG